jgi:hypothetical protein
MAKTALAASSGWRYQPQRERRARVRLFSYSAPRLYYRAPIGCRFIPSGSWKLFAGTWSPCIAPPDCARFRGVGSERSSWVWSPAGP